MDYKKKKIVVFDLDGTLAESKQGLDQEISHLLGELLKIKMVAIVTGGGFPQLKKQVLGRLGDDQNMLKNLYLFPTKGAAMYHFDGKEWQKLYEKYLTQEDKNRIRKAFDKVYEEVNFLPQDHYGDILEDRGAQFTFSALGQDAPPELKKFWDTDAKKRQEIKKHLDVYLPDFAVEIGGTTSIDITQKSIDKAYAIEQICAYLKLKIDEILFVGDAIFEGGNDYAVIKTEVENINVHDYHKTKDIIRDIIENNK